MKELVGTFNRDQWIFFAYCVNNVQYIYQCQNCHTARHRHPELWSCTTEPWAFCSFIFCHFCQFGNKGNTTELRELNIQQVALQNTSQKVTKWLFSAHHVYFVISRQPFVLIKFLRIGIWRSNFHKWYLHIKLKVSFACEDKIV